MVRTADAIVIGGGIAGVSTAYALAKGGLRRVVLLERESLASGATGGSVALIKVHYTNPWDAKLAFESSKVYANWGDAVGGECGFHRTGYLLLLAPDAIEHVHKNLPWLQQMGVTTTALSPGELHELQPFCDISGVGVAVYEPDAGYADPYLAVYSMAQRARDLGASVEQGTEVIGILRDGDKVVGVETRVEEIHAPIVVNAAGGAAAKVSQMAGVDVPVRSIRITAGAMQKPAELDGPLIFIYDTILNTYCRPDLGDTVVIAAQDDGPREVDPDQPAPLLGRDAVVAGGFRLAERIPLMMQAVPGRGWARIDGHTPDGHAIIGKAPELEGFYMAVGGSGKGFKVGPGVGMALAELILEGQTDIVDLHPFRLERFAEGEALQGEYPYPNVTIV